MPAKRLVSMAMILAIGLLVGQCGKSKGPIQTTTPDTTSVDSIPPAAITDLLAKNPTTHSVFLLWTAPGDDGLGGSAESYDIRYYSEPITDANWPIASQFDGEPAPKPAGQVETVNIDGLNEITKYFFAVKSTDDEGNTSALSNSVSETTLNESLPPAIVSDLGAVAVGDYSFLLAWTAPGDDGIVGTAAEYDIRYSLQPITEETFESATKVSKPPVPKPGGEPETLLVSNLRTPQSHYFALKTADEVPNLSEMSNVAFGLGYNVELAILGTHLEKGEEARIIFRAPGGRPVWINVNTIGIIECNPSNSWVKDSIVEGVRYPEGIHEIYYDFMVDGEYLPPDVYYIVLCWDFDYQTMGYVYFDNPTSMR